MVVSALVAEETNSNVATVTYKLPQELSQHVWRLACVENARAGAVGASESGLMEVAWRLFLGLSIQRNLELIGRTFRRRGQITATKRKTYSLPPDLISEISSRVNELKLVAADKHLPRMTLWLCAEAAQIHFVELDVAARGAAIARFGVRKKRQ